MIVVDICHKMIVVDECHTNFFREVSSGAVGVDDSHMKYILH